jgi:hypothetical protein
VYPEQVMMAYADHGKTSSAKRNSGQKPKLNERDHHALKRIVSKNQRTSVAKVTAELSIQLEDPVSTQQSGENFTTSMVELQLLNL